MADLNTMPVFTDAIMGDTTHLDDAEFGSYALLLFVMWRNGGWLPDDQELLRKYARCKPAKWAKRWVLLSGFFYVEGGKLRQKKLAETYRKAIEKRNRFRENGGKGGRPKSLKNKEIEKPDGLFPETGRGQSANTILKPESMNPNGKIESGANAPARGSKPGASSLPPELEVPCKAYFDRAKELRFAGSLSSQVAQLLKANGFYRANASIKDRLDAIQKSRANLESAARANVPRQYLARVISNLGETEAAQSGVNYDPAF